MSISCPLCHSEHNQIWSQTNDREYLTLPEKTFTYRLCEFCDILYIQEDLQNALTSIYPSSYYSFGKSRFSRLLNIKVFLDKFRYQHIIRNLKRPIRVLDIGGGAGDVVDLIIGSMGRENFQVTIVDIDASAETLARQRSFRYIRETFEAYVPDQNYDLVIALNIVEHVANPKLLISKIYECLSPSGIAIFQTPNFHSLDARLFRTRYWGGLHAPRHFVIFSSKSFTASLETSRFQVIEKHRIPGGTFWATSILGSGFTRSLKAPLIQNVFFFPLLVIFSFVDVIRGFFFETSQQMIVVSK